MRRVLMLCALAVLLSAAPARAEFSWKWSRADVALQATFLGVTAIDWSQTIHFTQIDRTRGSERNPILGPWPSRARVNTLIPLGMLAHTAVAAALPHGPLRSAWQFTWIAVETGAVGGNFSLGVGLATPW